MTDGFKMLQFKVTTEQHDLIKRAAKMQKMRRSAFCAKVIADAAQLIIDRKFIADLEASVDEVKADEPS